MKALVQRADGASVSVGGEVVGAFDGPGLVVLVGVGLEDTAAIAEKLAVKVHDLRIFDAGALRARGIEVEGTAREVSASDAGLPLLVISQFTLYGSTAKGRRPTWDAAAPGPVAEPLVEHVAAVLRGRGATVANGVFGADMRVSLVNDGPFTLALEIGG